MRKLMVVALLGLAACGEAEGGNKMAEEQAAKDALALQPGQWEALVDVTSSKVVDGTSPALKLAAGDKNSINVCVGAGEGNRPQPELLAGLAGADCDYQNIYMKRGRITATISCKHPEVAGDVLVSTDGTFTATGFEGEADISTILAGQGDSVVKAKIVGRKSAESCTTT